MTVDLVAVERRLWAGSATTVTAETTEGGEAPATSALTFVQPESEGDAGRGECGCG